MAAIPASLRALLGHLIDYAGLFPPAALSLEEVLRRYERYRTSADVWILNRLVLPPEALAGLPPDKPWRVSLVGEPPAGPLPPQVETIETKSDRHFGLPTYKEASLDRIHDGFAKIRTGGVIPDAIPTSETIAEFVHEAAARQIPFKATAGLHHPIRSVRPLTYE